MAKDINIIIKADSSQVGKAVDSANSSLGKLGKATGSLSGAMMKATAIGSTLGTIIGNGISKVFSVIASQTDNAVKRFDTLNNFPRVMQNLGISAEDSQSAIGYLSKKLEGLPTTLDEATTSVQRFTATNGNLRASTSIYLALNNAILAGGGSAQLQASAMEQLQQAYAKGKPEFQDWKILMQAMPAQLKQIANAMGYVDATQLYGALQDGKASMDDFMKATVRLNTEGINGLGSFTEQAEGATGGVATSFTNMKNAIVRGIASAMEAIGQSNIAGFFNVVKDVILTASNYVAAFIKLVLTAINAIRSLFGMGSVGGKTVSSSGDKASASMSNVGKSAKASTKDIGDTTKAAKKLQNQLSSFDEMNVLTSKDDSDSGGGGKNAKASPSYDTSGLDFDDAGIKNGADKVGEIFEGMKKTIQGVFGDINFTPLIASFKRLIGAISPLVGDIGKGLAWLFDNVLKPITKWTIEKAIPIFFDLIASAFKIIEPLIKGVGEGFAFIWDAFIGKVLGGAFDMATAFFQAISDVFKTIADNAVVATILEGIGITIGVIAGALAGITTLITVAVGVIGGIIAVVKVATIVFGVLTNPIAWVIAGITALVAVIGLCIKHWNDICKVVGDVMGEIGKFVGHMLDEFGKFINALVHLVDDIFKKFISPIIDMVVGNLANAFSSAFNTIGGIVSGVFNGFGNIVRSVFGVFNGLVNFISGVFTGNWARAWNGVGQVLSNIVNGFVNIVKFPINVIIDVINGFISGLNRIKIPDWVPAVGGKGINIPRIPRLAKGGVIDRATMAIIGENGREAVMPLENNTGWIEELASKLNQSNSNSQPLQVVVKLGEETIIDKIIDGVNDKTALSGRNVLLV